MPKTSFLWDPIEDNVVKELDDFSSAVAAYTTEPYLHGGLICQLRSGLPHYYHFDAQGNTTELTDSDGNTTDTRRYSAFGRKTEGGGSTPFSYEFNGRNGYSRLAVRIDSVRRREYDNELSRWLSRDPVLLGGPRSAAPRNPLDSVDINAYIYVLNRPVLYIDPSGLQGTVRNNLALPVCCLFAQACCNPLTLEVTRDMKKRTCVCQVVGTTPKKGGLVMHIDPTCCKSDKELCTNPFPYGLFCKKGGDIINFGPCIRKRIPETEARCRNLLIDWILGKDEGLSSAGYSKCMDWCNECYAIGDGVDRAQVEEYCIRGICMKVFGNVVENERGVPGDIRLRIRRRH